MSKTIKVRTRFAPSPTGFLHVGGLRTALYNFLYARKHGGQFLLRLEDTDQDRLVSGAMEDILNSLKTCGITYDEGPDKGGSYGPYIQSQRLQLYKQHADQLVAEGKAYHCYCSEDRLEKMREVQMSSKMPPKYDRHCLNMSAEEKALYLNKSHVIRFKIPDMGVIEYVDLVKGAVSFSAVTQEDFVMLKSDGYPTYHLANIVDDHLMQISHVIRGDEWLSSVPKHILLYKALGWTAPQFAHIPLLLNKDRSKMSKRHGDVSVRDFLAKGYLEQTLVNFIALLGWNPGTDEEIFTLDQLVEKFDISGINKSGAIFDLEKLDWMNGFYIRHLSIDDLYQAGLPYLENAGIKGEKEEFIKAVIKLEQDRLKKLSDLPEATGYFFAEKLEYPVDMLRWKHMDTEKVKIALKVLLAALEKLENVDFKGENLLTLGKTLAVEHGLKTGELFWPWRVALTGREASPSPNDISGVLGKEKTLKRLNHAITLLP